MNKELNTYAKKQNPLRSSLKVAETVTVNDLEKYQQLRRPHPTTLLKLQDQLENGEMTNTKLVKSTRAEKNLEIPSSQELLTETTNTTLIQNEVKKIQEILLNDNIYNLDSNEAQPLNLPTEVNLLQINKNAASEQNNQNALPSRKKSFNYIEDLLVGIFYTKVRCHPNGFFAENLPNWYKETFDKDPSADWLELIEASNKFIIEKVENKIILYAKSKEDLNENINLNAIDEEKVQKPSAQKEQLSFQTKESKASSESSVNFTPCKHLKNSLKEYSKYVGSDKTKAGKNKEKQNKSKIRST